ncbi:MAG: hypothetical protein ACYC8T_29820 [Myxococcaceae bacterium]
MPTAPVPRVFMLMCRAALLFALMFVAGCARSSPSTGSRPRAAAVAIRDAVPAYQQWGSEGFTVPYLSSGYERHWYLTESAAAKKGEALRTALDEATREFEVVDLFLLAHGNRYVEDVASLAPEQRRRVRLVYNTGGGDADQGPRWLSLGVGAYVAHPGGNVAPVFYGYFLPAWVDGMALGDAVDHANRKTHGHLTSSAASTAFEWSEKLGGPRVDAARLWEGTEAQLFGDPALSSAPAPAVTGVE